MFDLTTRRTLDREAIDKGVAFMERHAKAKQPFFLFLPLTQVHFPTLAHPDFAGTTGAGDVGDAMAEMDHNVGVVLDAIERLGLDRQHHRHLDDGRRRRVPAALARHRRARGAGSTRPRWKAGCGRRS